MAARHGWHVSLPFLATWVVLLLVVVLSHHFTQIIGAAWHTEKISATPELKAIEAAIQHYAMTNLLPQVMEQATQAAAKAAAGL
ncbi:hypothetical protein EAS64_33690 [Trebonia kvetii]|uniref:Uncharacterized protein n=1 Tax=Trebonia kvetii TaxID=2480626 RepID=A0A6P2BQE7_9ACTN|nr:hypothetical protein [Trebonia kvetii]TVZ01234.1 hypothetical protein EAS64_33690 [Trebonia kvetii]